MEDGPKYIISKEGIVKLIVLFFGCTTFALLADSHVYTNDNKLSFVLADFIVAFSISTLFYFFRLIGLSKNMNCGGPCSYDGFDFVWAWFCTAWCFAGAIVYAVNFPSGSVGTPNYDKAISSIVFAFVTFICYAIEAFMLRLHAPANMGYVATKFGWMKTGIVVFGAATFGLLVDGDYKNENRNWCGSDDGCVAGLTYALCVFCISWGITTIMWIAHMAGPKGSIQSPKFQKVEFVWSIISILLFWTGASCFAAYMKCHGDDFDGDTSCQKRLTGVLCGFLTGLLYLVDAIMLRPSS